MNKELLIKEGKELKEAAKKNQNIKKMMDKAINATTQIGSRDIVDQMIKAALMAETDVQELINHLNADESERQKAMMYFQIGYTQG